MTRSRPDRYVERVGPTTPGRPPPKPLTPSTERLDDVYARHYADLVRRGYVPVVAAILADEYARRSGGAT